MLAGLLAAAAGASGKGLLLEARALANQGQTDAAEQLLLAAQAAMPLSAEPLLLRANLLAFRRGKPEEAIEAYRSSIEKEPTAEAHFFMGKAYSMLQRWGDAVEAFQGAVALSPSNTALFVELANALVHSSSWPAAKDALLAAASQDPNSPAPLVALAETSRRHSSWSETVTAYRNVTELHPWHAQYMLELASLLEQQVCSGEEGASARREGFGWAWWADQTAMHDEHL